MPFLSDASWESLGQSIISNFSPERVKHGAYELSMGNEYFVTAKSGKKVLTHGQQFDVPAGQMALLLTKEEVSIPQNHIGLISVKATSKFQGLVNISGFHVDPGFKGRLKFSVYNAGSRDISLEEGAPTFLLWIAKFDGKCQPYDGEHNQANQATITTKEINCLRGKLPSPVNLESKISKLELKMTVLLSMSSALLIPAMIWTIKTINLSGLPSNSGRGGTQTTNIGAFHSEGCCDSVLASSSGACSEGKIVSAPSDSTETIGERR